MNKEEMIKILQQAKEKLTESGNDEKIRLINALLRTVEMTIKDTNYLDATLRQRISGSENAGSWYDNMTEKELLEKIISPDSTLSEYTPENAMPGCSYYRIGIPGKIGIVDIDDLPDESPLFLSISHRGTDKFSLLTTAKVSPKEEPNTTIILGQEDGIGEVMFTLHPGDPVQPSNVTLENVIEELNPFFDGNAKWVITKSLEHYNEDIDELAIRITKVQAKSLGLDKSKIVSEGFDKKIKLDCRSLKGTVELKDDTMDKAEESEFFEKLINGEIHVLTDANYPYGNDKIYVQLHDESGTQTAHCFEVLDWFWTHSDPDSDPEFYYNFQREEEERFIVSDNPMLNGLYIQRFPQSQSQDYFNDLEISEDSTLRYLSGCSPYTVGAQADPKEIEAIRNGITPCKYEKDKIEEALDNLAITFNERNYLEFRYALIDAIEREGPNMRADKHKDVKADIRADIVSCLRSISAERNSDEKNSEENYQKLQNSISSARGLYKKGKRQSKESRER